MLKTRPVHGSGQFGFGLNPNPTRQCQVEGEGTWNRPWHQLVESISGSSDAQVNSINGESHQNLQMSLKSAKTLWNLLGFGQIWLNLTRSGRYLIGFELDLAGVGRILYIGLIRSGGSSFGEENPPLDSLTSILGGGKSVDWWERRFGGCWSGLDTPT